MIHKLVAVFACLGFVSQAAAEVKFDQGVDVTNVIEQAKASDVKAPYSYYGPHRVRWSKECRNFNYSGGYAQSSERVHLQSTEYIEDCRFVPNPPPPPPPPHINPNGPKPGHPKASEVKDYYPGQPGYYPGQPGYQPGYPGNDFGPHGNYSYTGSYGGQQGTWYCHERMGQSFRTTAQVNVPQRQMYPWESESFEVCQEADRQTFDTRRSPYRYSVGREGMYDVTYNLTPSYRTPTAPDANGLNAASFAFRDGKFVLDVSDRWAEYYPGEKVKIKIELMKDGFLFFNSSQGVKEFTFDTAGSYQLSFVEGDLEKTENYTDTSGDMRGPKKYYVKWGFSRLGTVSTSEYVKKDATDKITK